MTFKDIVKGHIENECRKLVRGLLDGNEQNSYDYLDSESNDVEVMPDGKYFMAFECKITVSCNRGREKYELEVGGLVDKYDIMPSFIQNRNTKKYLWVHDPSNAVILNCESFVLQ